MSGNLVIFGKGNSREQGREWVSQYNAIGWGINNVERWPEIHMLWEMHPWTKKIKDLNPVQLSMVPVMMQEQYLDVPNSMRYPIEHIRKVYGKNFYANNTLAYMFMYALLMDKPFKVKTIFLAGIDYRSANRVEIEFERACTEFWIGFAMAKGVNVFSTEESTLMSYPGYVKGVQYGYTKDFDQYVLQHIENYSHTCSEMLLQQHGNPAQFKDHDHDEYHAYLVDCVKAWSEKRLEETKSKK